MSKATLNKIEAVAALTTALAAAITAAKAAGLETDEITKQFEAMTEIMSTDE